MSRTKRCEMDMSFILTCTTLSLFLLFTSHVHAHPNIYDVQNYGAKADQVTDLSQALLSAWKDACASPNSSKVFIPKGTYLLNPITLQGPCKNAIRMQAQGIFKAPIDISKFEESSWVTFNYINDFKLYGGGVFDGQGAAVWSKHCPEKKDCPSLPINLRFNFITNAKIRGITSKDSKQFHVNVLGCNNLTFQRFKVIAPENSPNTDGIHIGQSSHINIIDSIIGTGDDCISLSHGSRQVRVTGVTCGPGHGISVGSLGGAENEEPVVGLTVNNCTLINTQNGVRIKTWPSSKTGVVSDMHFEDVVMVNVGYPIVIDQQYCPWNKCNLKFPSKVKINNVSFKNIRGSSSTQVAVKISCSSGLPCESVELGDINLTYNGSEGPALSQCSNVQPLLSGKLIPPACGSLVPPLEI